MDDMRQIKLKAPDRKTTRGYLKIRKAWRQFQRQLAPYVEESNALQKKGEAATAADAQRLMDISEEVEDMQVDWIAQHHEWFVEGVNGYEDACDCLVGEITGEQLELFTQAVNEAFLPRKS